MAISKRTRFEVLRRDNYTCRYCRSEENALTVDHVTPVALGGTDAPDNLVAACRDCNAGKASGTPDEGTVAQVKDDAARWSAAMTQAAELLEQKADERSDYVAAFMDAWPQHRYLPPNIIVTVERFFEMGLPQSVMVDAVVSAMTTQGVYDRPAYFAGICWKRVRAMQEIAGQIVSGDADG